MAEEFPDYDDFYIFSKDRRNHSVDAVNAHRLIYNTLDYDYVNSHSERQIEREYFTQKSLPNLKQPQRLLYKQNLLSESEPLLGNNYRKRRYFCNEAIEFTRYKRTQICLFFYVVFYVGFLIVGSLCFQRLEYSAEQAIRQNFRDAREDFLEDHPSITGIIWCGFPCSNNCEI